MKKKNLDKKEMVKVLDTISVAKAKSVRGGSNLQANKFPVNIGISISINF